MRTRKRARPPGALRSWWQRCLDSDDGRLWLASLPALLLTFAITSPITFFWTRAEEGGPDPEAGSGS